MFGGAVLGSFSS